MIGEVGAEAYWKWSCAGSEVFEMFKISCAVSERELLALLRVRFKISESVGVREGKSG